MKNVKDYQLNPKQVHVLKLVYKFRFVTSSLLMSYRNNSHRAVTNSLLKTLWAKGYLSRRYDKSFKFQGKGACYYLDGRGIAFLRDDPIAHEPVLHAYSWNDKADDSFIDKHLDTMKAYLALRESYPETFHIFTRYELGGYDFFPEPKPALYLNRITTAKTPPNEYMLDILPKGQFFLVKKRLEAVIEHFDEGEWEAGSGTDYPAVLFVCPDAKTEQKLQRHAAKVLDNAGIDDLKIFTANLKALQDSSQSHKKIWSDVYKPKPLVSLN